MLAILKIINLHFWKSFFGPFFAFVFPLIFVALLGSLLGYDQLFGGSMAIASMSIALTAMPQAIFEFKRSALLKRIGVTPIKPWMFLAVSAGFYFVVMIVSSFWTLAVGIGIFSQYMNEGKEIMEANPAQGAFLSASLGQTLANVNWAGFLWGLIMNIFVGISLGFVLVSTSKSTLAIQGLGIPILILCQFLSAQVLPLPMIINVEFMKWISYLSPFRYSTGLMIESFTGIMEQPVFGGPEVVTQIEIIGSANIFDINTPFEMIKYKGTTLVTMFDKTDKVLNLIMPIVFTGIFTGIAVKTFKWSAR
ncbi:MAG: ABC transporter permease [Mycoplasmataceae bacterium]|nr:ABC transporter permease [Mycoplasmataceae bacterium]